MVTLNSTCCNAEDRLFRRVLQMNYSEMGICPRCGEHCDFKSEELIKQLKKSVKGKDQISVGIRNCITEGTSHLEIIDYIKSQARDNMTMMYQVLGFDLTTKILSV